MENPPRKHQIQGALALQVHEDIHALLLESLILRLNAFIDIGFSLDQWQAQAIDGPVEFAAPRLAGVVDALAGTG